MNKQTKVSKFKFKYFLLTGIQLFSFFCFGFSGEEKANVSEARGVEPKGFLVKKTSDCLPLNGLEALEHLNNTASILFENPMSEASVQSDLDRLTELYKLKESNLSLDLKKLSNLEFEKSTQILISKMARHLVLRGLSENSPIDRKHLGADLRVFTGIQMFLKSNPELYKRKIDIVNIANNLLDQPELKEQFDVLNKLGAHYDVGKRIWNFNKVSGEALSTYPDKLKLKKALELVSTEASQIIDSNSKGGWIGNVVYKRNGATFVGTSTELLAEEFQRKDSDFNIKLQKLSITMQSLLKSIERANTLFNRLKSEFTDTKGLYVDSAYQKATADLAHWSENAKPQDLPPAEIHDSVKKAWEKHYFSTGADKKIKTLIKQLDSDLDELRKYLIERVGESKKMKETLEAIKQTLHETEKNVEKTELQKGRKRVDAVFKAIPFLIVGLIMPPTSNVAISSVGPISSEVLSLVLSRLKITTVVSSYAGVKAIGTAAVRKYYSGGSVLCHLLDTKETAMEYILDSIKWISSLGFIISGMGVGSEVIAGQAELGKMIEYMAGTTVTALFITLQAKPIKADAEACFGSSEDKIERAQKAERCLSLFLRVSWLMYGQLSEERSFQSFLKKRDANQEISNQ